MFSLFNIFNKLKIFIYGKYKIVENLAVSVVGDFKFLYKYFSQFKRNLTISGKFTGDIVIITSNYTPTFLLPSTYGERINIVRFKKIKFSESTNGSLNNNFTNGQPNRNKTKSFQWHKLHLFDVKLKKWKYIFYLDINMQIHHDISGLLQILPKRSIFARADSYPDYTKSLSSQFDKTSPSYRELCKKYDLNIKNYFQTGLLFYDTEIIETQTKQNLMELVDRFPCTITNEQAIFNLYFIFDKNQYSELVQTVGRKISYFYWLLPDKEVIISKQNRIQYK
jgi:hypothetical protein